VKTPVAVRRAMMDDLQLIHEVATATWWDTYKDLFPAEVIALCLKRSYSVERLRVRLQQADAFLVAERDGLVVGFAQFSRRDVGEIVLSSIYVQPEEQGSGVGTLLLDHGVRALAPVQRLFVEVEERNWKGRRFYRKKGFKFSRSFGVNVVDCPTVLQELILDLTAPVPVAPVGPQVWTQ